MMRDASDVEGPKSRSGLLRTRRASIGLNRLLEAQRVGGDNIAYGTWSAFLIRLFTIR
jgi:hypothetical protein